MRAGRDFPPNGGAAGGTEPALLRIASGDFVKAEIAPAADHPFVGKIDRPAEGAARSSLAVAAMADGIEVGLALHLDAAGAGLQQVCDAAKKAASDASGTKGIVSDIVKAAVEPVIGAIKDGVSALWTRHIAQEQAEIDSIKGQLQAAKWPEF